MTKHKSKPQEIRKGQQKSKRERRAKRINRTYN